MFINGLLFRYHICGVMVSECGHHCIEILCSEFEIIYFYEYAYLQVNSLSGLIVVIFGNLSEFSINDIIITLGLVTGVSVLWVCARQRVLAEDGLVSAEERVLIRLGDFSGVILNWQADVEDLAVVGYVGVVTVGTALTCECLRRLTAQDIDVS